jgi:hypothetical protein
VEAAINRRVKSKKMLHRFSKPLYQDTTQWILHICPVFADMETRNPGQPVLYQGTSLLVPKRPE